MAPITPQTSTVQSTVGSTVTPRVRIGMGLLSALFLFVVSAFGLVAYKREHDNPPQTARITAARRLPHIVPREPLTRTLSGDTVVDTARMRYPAPVYHPSPPLSQSLATDTFPLSIRHSPSIPSLSGTTMMDGMTEEPYTLPPPAQAHLGRSYDELEQTSTAP
ncbi:hypothetical protein AcV7_005035 [Taiwanofungus camphoratus]|nr:hypothetical protein AcV7_005035 [Antrodia cinnamomea]